MALDKSIDELGEADFQLLVDEQVSEKRNIEYKSGLPSETRESKKELLADVSSLANAAGGHLILGIREENGIPTAMPGVQREDPDKEVLRLENIIRDGIEPRIQGVQAKAIPLSTGTSLFVLRIPQSWSKPHVVNYQGHWKFYSRNSAGKYPLDVSEVRSAFLLSGTLLDRIKLFRDGQLGSIISDQTPARLVPGGRTVLHIVPYAAFAPAASFPLDAIAKSPWPVRPIDGSLTDYRYNFDGCLIINGNEAGQCRGYVQVFRSGIIEAVDASLLRRRGAEHSIPSRIFEQGLIGATEMYLAAQKQLAIPPPIAILVTLLGVSGYTMAVSQFVSSRADTNYPIDRDTLVLPEFILEDYPSDVPRALKSTFDTIWNAAGWPTSLGYDEQGEWGKGPNFLR
jgi:hypothetical protein